MFNSCNRGLRYLDWFFESFHYHFKQAQLFRKKLSVNTVRCYFLSNEITKRFDSIHCKDFRCELLFVTRLCLLGGTQNQQKNRYLAHNCSRSSWWNYSSKVCLQLLFPLGWNCSYRLLTNFCSYYMGKILLGSMLIKVVLVFPYNICSRFRNTILAIWWNQPCIRMSKVKRLQICVALQLTKVQQVRLIHQFLSIFSCNLSPIEFFQHVSSFKRQQQPTNCFECV